MWGSSLTKQSIHCWLTKLFFYFGIQGTYWIKQIDFVKCIVICILYMSNRHHHHSHHHLSIMLLGHFSIHSSLTHPEGSSVVSPGSPGSFCLLVCSFLLSSVICYEAFCLHVVSSFFCSLVFCPELGLCLIPLQSLCLFYILSKCILLIFKYISSLLLFFLHLLVQLSNFH